MIKKITYIKAAFKLESTKQLSVSMYIYMHRNDYI